MIFSPRESVGARVGLVFGLVAFVLVACIGFAVHRMSTLKELIGESINQQATAALLAVQMESLVSQRGVSLRNSILLDNPKQIRQEMAAMTNLAGEMNDLEKKIQVTLRDVAGKSAFELVGQTKRAYDKQVAEILADLESGDSDSARAKITGDAFRAVGVAYVDSLRSFVSLQRSGLKNANADALSTYSIGRNSLAAVTLIAIAAGIAAIIWLVHTIARPAQRAILAAEKIAEGDLTSDLHTRGKDEICQVLLAMQGMQLSLRQTVDTIRQGASQVSTASAEIASGNQDLSGRTESQSGSLQATSSTMTSMSEAVRQTAQSAKQANELVASASEVASRGGEVVSRVVHTMSEINQSSQRIAEIIGVIDGIAFQTNILALNAAVEAARAGEQGRGFAVVASEVRSLAQRSANAAKEIKGLISASVEKVSEGASLVDSAGSTMHDIVTSVQRVADIIGEISVAAAEQSDGIDQVNTAVLSLDQGTQQNAALVEQSAAAAESLKDQAHRLAELVSAFKLP